VGPQATANPSLAFDLPSSLRAPGTARRIIASLKDAIGARVHEDLSLLLCEVITNSVVHADLRSDERIRVRLTYARGWVRGEVLDAGSGFEPPHDVPVGTARSHGYGLLLLSRMSSRWGAERIRGGMRVWFELGERQAVDPSAPSELEPG
jgi:anti-sigma regulatory factor (Ser/Thr protein kinase)